VILVVVVRTLVRTGATLVVRTLVRTGTTLVVRTLVRTGATLVVRTLVRTGATVKYTRLTRVRTGAQPLPDVGRPSRVRIWIRQQRGWPLRSWLVRHDRPKW